MKNEPNLNEETLKGGRGKCSLCNEWHNNVAYHEAHECAERPCWDCGKPVERCECGVVVCEECGEETGMCVCRIQSAPDWLVERMANLAKMGPPTLQEVMQQMEASEKYRKENIR